jgi:acetyl-CoA C-acetyltransferase
MTRAVIVDAVRTPIGKFGGCLQSFSAPELGGIVIKELVTRLRIPMETVDEVLMGNVVSAGLGQNPARQAAIAGKLPETIPATTINKVCGSGLKTIMLAADGILAGRSKLMIAGGMESMTNAPYLLEKARFGYRMFDGKLVDAMVRDGLWDKFNDFHMGMTGEIVAERHNVTREEADAFAARSHRLAIEATNSGRFAKEIVPITIEQKGQTVVIDKDEGPRADSTPEKLAKLKPVFKENGIVTAGNASSINDGAAATIVASEEIASSYATKVSVNIVDYVTVATRPEWLMEAPIAAIRKLLERNSLSVNDVDLYEHNEAFATASVAVMKALSLSDDNFNIHGGAVALGHPIGASGARVMTTLMYSLAEKGLSRGIATLCLGGGEAVAMLVERR